MRALLIHTPIWTVRSPPLNVPYLAAYLRRAGHDVAVIDMNCELYHSGGRACRGFWDRAFLFQWQDFAEFSKTILPRLVGPSLSGYASRAREFRPDLVGLSCNSWGVTKVLSEALKAALPRTPIVAGGQMCEPGFYGREFAEFPSVDAVVFGEGEETLAEIAQTAAGRGAVAPVAGTITRGPGGLVEAPPRPRIGDIDALPFPDFAGLDVDRYTDDIDDPLRPSRYFSILSSRGCVRHCDFCLQQAIWRGKYRARSPENVVEEIRLLRDGHGMTRFHFNDLSLNGDVPRLAALCALMARETPGIEWEANVIIRPEMTGEVFGAMRRAGCRHVVFGIESGSDTVLAEMGKGYGAKVAAAVIGSAVRAGMSFSSDLIVGHPAEGRREFIETLEFLLENRALFSQPPNVSLCIIQRGSVLHGKAERLGLFINGGDALGWSRIDGQSDLDERKFRAKILDMFYRGLFSRGLSMTDMEQDRVKEL
ncbi:MAG: B12-binding domain-containing radical SAM protein [Deltaproteobacteria bacterium]|nr:B12-binding domain-containing radical SAM protein [Deltaproteobacteria bacterium]